MALLTLTALLLVVACQGVADTPTSLPRASATASAESEEPEGPSNATTRPTAGPAESSPTPSATDTAESLSDPTAPPATATPPLAGDGAGNADVLFVRAEEQADGTWTFHVTVEHPDTGWEDYADGWDVVTPDGTVLKADPEDPFTRLLLHPHENEQPFTRSQSGLMIPQGMTEVTVRAHDIVDGYGGQEVTVDLSAASGPSFEVERQS